MKLNNFLIKNEYSKLPSGPMEVNGHEVLAGSEFPLVIDSEAIESEWFCPNMSRKESEVKLAKKKTGAFFIRKCSNIKLGSFCLSLKGRQRLYHHLLIINEAEQNIRVNGEVKSFKSLSELVTHHSVMSEVPQATLIIPKVKRENHILVDVYRKSEYRKLIKKLQEYLLA